MSDRPPIDNFDIILRYLSFASEINQNLRSVIHLTNNLRYNTFQLYNHHINNSNLQINDIFFPPPFIAPPPPIDPPPATLRRRRRRATTIPRVPTRTFSLPPLFQNINRTLNTISPPRAPSLTHILRSTETTTYADISTNHIMCPISQQCFRDNDRVTRIRYCGHLFHADYIRQWFQGSSECPVCRYNILRYNGRRENTRDGSNNNPFYDLSGNLSDMDHTFSRDLSGVFSLSRS